MVILYHTANFCCDIGLPSFKGLPIFRKGHESVLMFFSLSGFLIIRQLYLERKNTQTISLLNFYKKRALRILPVYYLVFVIGLLHCYVIIPSFESTQNTYSNLWETILLGGTFLANILSSDFQPINIIQVLWSLGIEEQFYLLIAPILLFIPSHKILHFLSLFTIAYLLIFFNKHFAFLKHYSLYFYFFSAGGVASILELEFLTFTRFKWVRYFTLLILFIYFTSDLFFVNLSNSRYYIFSVFLFSISIGLFSTESIGIFDNNPIRFLGERSYGIYMYHAIVLNIIGAFYFILNPLNYLSPLMSIIICNFLTFITTTVIACISYTYYEKKFLNLKASHTL
jgi:peptidoglycan/LPS O-acetylase OafA/YrhL